MLDHWPVSREVEKVKPPVLRTPSVPVAALRVILKRQPDEDTVVEAYQRLCEDLACLCDVAEGKA